MKEPTTLKFEYSVVSSLSLVPLLTSNYNLSKETKVEYLYQGFNDTYLVSTLKAKFILRIYRSNWKSLDDIEGEIELLLLLNNNQIPVSYPICNSSGGFVTCLDCPEGNRYAVLFTFASGESISILKPESAKLFGQHLARLHALTENKEIEKLSKRYTVSEILSSTNKKLKQRLGESTPVFEKMLRIGKQLDERLNIKVLNKLRQGICHGDPHYENAFLESQKMTFFDFDFCGNGYLHYDLGSFYRYERGNEQNRIQFLEGYEQIRPLNKMERDLIPYFEVLMRIYHLGARAKNADGIKNPLWPLTEIDKMISDIEQQLINI